MLERHGYIYSDVCQLMKTEEDNCAFKIKESNENRTKAANFDADIRNADSLIEICQAVLDSLKPLINDIEEYIGDKRAKSQAALDNALRLASEIVPASMRGIAFKFDGDEAWLQAPNGAYVTRTEGSGYKGTTSVLLRSSVLAANPDKLQFMILDEPLAKLSGERTAQLSKYLPLITRNQQVILIEQKKEIYASTEATLYEFFKHEDYTTIERRDVNG